MNLSSFCVDRPVFTIVLNILIVLAGIVALQNLPLRQLPRVESPVVSVTTTYPGAAPALVEQQLTTPLEEQLGGIDGLRFMTSSSTSGSSVITLTFKLGKDTGATLNNVRALVSKAEGTLPDDANTPVVAKFDPDAQPFMYLAVTSDRMDSLAITDYLKRFALNSFRNVNGIATIQLLGSRDYEMSIAVDPEELAERNLTVADIESAVVARNITLPAGEINTKARRYSLRTNTALRTAKEFNHLVVDAGPDYLIRLNDVAKAEFSGTQQINTMRVNGKASVGLGLIRTATANPIDVTNDIRALIDKLKSTLPAGMKMEIVFDGTIFIEKSIDEVYWTLGEAFVLVLITIVLFLGSLRSSLVPLVAIPISIIGVLAIMSALGYSLNTLTLLALVVAVGLVVDDAIVVVENVHRHLEKGLPPIEATKKGMNEITFVVVSTTITLAAVFIPVGIMPGITGQFFKEFAFTLAGAVVISGFVALTLSPMMSSRVLKAESGGAFGRFVDSFLGKVSRKYRSILNLTLIVRPLMVVLAIAVAAGAYFINTQLKPELVPLEDQGNLVVFAQGPTNANFDYSNKYTKKIEAIIAKHAPALESRLALAGRPALNKSIVLAVLKPWKERPNISVQDVQRALWGPLAALPGVQAFPIIPASFGSGASSQPVAIAIKTVKDYGNLNAIMSRLQAKASKLPELLSVRSDLRLDSLAFNINVDRDQAAILGTTEAEIGATLGSLFGGSTPGKFEHNGKEFDVRIRLDASRRSSPQDIDQIYMHGRGDAMIPLSAVASVTPETVPASLAHYDQLRSATLSASLAPGVSLGQGLAALEKVLAQELSSETSYSLTGQSLDFMESQSSATFVFGLALVVVFLVLAAQFESFRDPFVVLLTVPLAVAGALGALLLSGHTSNVYSMIGIITLVGLITKHGIMICAFANQLQEQDGLDKREAVLQAAEMRLRPILMTSGAMILGVLPLALASGPGAMGRQAIGVSVVGGLAVGTLLTLFVIPSVYSYLARERNKA